MPASLNLSLYPATKRKVMQPTLPFDSASVRSKSSCSWNFLRIRTDKPISSTITGYKRVSSVSRASPLADCYLRENSSSLRDFYPPNSGCSLAGIDKAFYPSFYLRILALCTRRPIDVLPSLSDIEIGSRIKIE